jgi:hypothetical protein
LLGVCCFCSRFWRVCQRRAHVMNQIKPHNHHRNLDCKVKLKPSCIMTTEMTVCVTQVTTKAWLPVKYLF